MTNTGIVLIVFAVVLGRVLGEVGSAWIIGKLNWAAFRRKYPGIASIEDKLEGE